MTLRKTAARLPKQLAAASIAVACLTALTAPARAEYKSWVLATFDDTPEGLGVDAAGNIYTALFHTGRLMMIKPDGTTEQIAWVPSKEASGKGDLVGLELDEEGNIFVAYKENSPKYAAGDLANRFHPACKDATVTQSGVYRIDAKTREVTALATKADGWPFCFPDDVDIDASGNIYLTDLTYAGIWKISPDGSKVDLWSGHPLLNWSHPPYSGLPLGVNVLVLDEAETSIYAATDGDPMVLKLPIKEDGSAGEPVVLSRGYSPFDGIALDDKGNIYLSEILRSEIWVLSPDGSQRMLVASKQTAPLDNNTSLIWHDGVLCTANLGFTHESPADADKTIVCMSGFETPSQ